MQVFTDDPNFNIPVPDYRRDIHRIWTNENFDMSQVKSLLVDFHEYYDNLSQVPELWVDTYQPDEDVDTRVESY